MNKICKTKKRPEPKALGRLILSRLTQLLAISWTIYWLPLGPPNNDFKGHVLGLLKRSGQEHMYAGAISKWLETWFFVWEPYLKTNLNWVCLSVCLGPLLLYPWKVSQSSCKCLLRSPNIPLNSPGSPQIPQISLVPPEFTKCIQRSAKYTSRSHTPIISLRVHQVS